MAPFSFEAADAARAAEGAAAGIAVSSSSSGSGLPAQAIGAPAAGSAAGSASAAAAGGLGGRREVVSPSEPRERRTQVGLRVCSKTSQCRHRTWPYPPKKPQFNAFCQLLPPAG